MGATPKMNRSAKGGARSSLHYEGEGVLIHPPHQGVCGWHGTEERCVTSGGLADWINPTGARKAHSLIDKVYQRKNLEKAWEMVKANRGSGGVDGQSLEGFAAQLDHQLDRWHRELKDDVYRPQPVRQVQIPK